ncbi:prephenate dehydrogenase/arogenate dehydrogenase family protein [Alloacidobacterium dinghuense]|uniref:Prephenate dehydrogenase/arogenate dehydrogenase family protein n=1 Tax=Alloacidobacterium dinghuense TaxID=2763107 RepID=A0A7G8BHG3_9BACT|nr:prephenate dehydrogenase/arogenate dehydrogenase family protein [Alloacidobacterium dinghuense]QNI31983.1 prephenate dehydrogenase/arogenate dehydrogenase family protein [Alloacidobacterium dinghuense]
MPIERVAILGTGLIGGSVGMALRQSGFRGTIFGWDRDPAQAAVALSRAAIDVIAEEPLTVASESDLVLLSGPVFSILIYIEQLASILKPHQLVTDVGSVKGVLCQHAAGRYNHSDKPGFLPGHPMAGKEVGGVANADDELFRGAVWLFTKCADHSSMSAEAQAKAAEWRSWVQKFGCRVLDVDPDRHDELCAWVSHLPQFVSTALSALLEEKFPHDEDLRAIGGRALREMTRLGASPYSMWRDIAHTNSEAVAATLLALEQRLTHLREHLKTPELREEFELANRFRLGAPSKP